MRRWLLVFAILLATGPIAAATDLRGVITDVTISSWNEKDGLPAALIGALAQDAEGYLWVGTRQGLLRFDGVRFTPWDAFGTTPLPDVWVRSLLAARDGSVWVGFGSGGTIARIQGQALTTFTKADGLQRGSVLAIAEDADGAIWAGGENGLYAFDGTRWSRWGSARGLPEGTVYSAFGERSGNLYAAVGRGVFVRYARGDRFDQIGEFGDTFGSFAQTPDGTVWFTDPTTGYRPAGAVVAGEMPARQGRGLRMVVDRKGSLWVGTGGQGLWRARSPVDRSASPERASSVTGLLGDGIYALLEDRDGNIWAGTTEGLNRVTPRTIEQIIDLGLVRGVAMQPDGRVWIRTVNRLFAYPPGPGQSRSEFPIPPDARAIAPDANGMWVAAAGGGLFRTDASGRTARVRWPGEASAGELQAIAADGDGGLWLVTSSAGIVRWHDGAVRPLTLPEAVRGARVTAAFVDSRRRAWFAFDNGRVLATPPDGTATLLPLPATTAVYRVVHEDDRQRIWLGGDGALTRYEDGYARTLSLGARFAVSSISAIVTDDNESVWLGTPAGVVHLARDEFDRATGDPGASPTFTVYTRSDGIAGTPVAVGLHRGALRSPDGRLWFVTTRGITVLDPHVLDARTAPMAVRFEAAVVDDRRFAPGAGIRLPAGARKLEIDYTVVNLTTPLKTRFRYRLDPFDPDWVQAGSRRQAFYTNLKPGQYVFHVAAADAMRPAASHRPKRRGSCRWRRCSIRRGGSRHWRRSRPVWRCSLAGESAKGTCGRSSPCSSPNARAWVVRFTTRSCRGWWPLRCSSTRWRMICRAVPGCRIGSSACAIASRSTSARRAGPSGTCTHSLRTATWWRTSGERASSRQTAVRSPSRCRCVEPRTPARRRSRSRWSGLHRRRR
jgi:ligand-binding sensor domain-containing protein